MCNHSNNYSRMFGRVFIILELDIFHILIVIEILNISIFALMIIAAEFRLDFILKYFRFLEGNIGKGWFLIL